MGEARKEARCFKNISIEWKTYCSVASCDSTQRLRGFQGYICLITNQFGTIHIQEVFSTLPKLKSVLSATSVELRVQSNDSQKTPGGRRMTAGKEKHNFSRKLLSFPDAEGRVITSRLPTGISPAMLMPTNELKELPESIVTAYIGYRSIMETSRNVFNFLTVCFCLLSSMNCDFVENVQIKTLFFWLLFRLVFIT